MKTWDEIRESAHLNCGTDDCCQECDTAITEVTYRVGDKKQHGNMKAKDLKDLMAKVKAAKFDMKTLEIYDKDARKQIMQKGQMVESEDIEEAMSSKEKAAHDKAIADFKKKGGKIKKLKPGKAQGYHGKDDPGDNVAGMLDKGDSSKFKRGKKVRSMRAGYESFKTHEAREIDSKKMSMYMKFVKAKKVDDDGIRMAHDNPNHPESKRMMKNKDFAKALKMYKDAEK